MGAEEIEGDTSTGNTGELFSLSETKKRNLEREARVKKAGGGQHFSISWPMKTDNRSQEREGGPSRRKPPEPVKESRVWDKKLRSYKEKGWRILGKANANGNNGQLMEHESRNQKRTSLRVGPT